MDSDNALVAADWRGSPPLERAKLSRTADLERDSGGLELISKAGAVLDILEQHKEASAADLAAALGEPLSSVYRLLQSLTATGWVDRGSRRGAYRLGLSLMTIGGLVEDHLDIRDASLPSLRELVDATKATSFLCVRRGARAVCLERIEGYAVQSLAMLLGGSLPLYAGAAPRALLAFLPVAEQSAILKDTSQQLLDDPPRPDDKDIIADIARIRAAGYSVSDGDVTPGIASLGAPVFNHRGEVQGALSLSGLRGQVLNPAGVDDTIELLRLAAGKASAALGWEVS
jgi:DNA-binding IclR family transcriptional regulator